MQNTKTSVVQNYVWKNVSNEMLSPWGEKGPILKDAVSNV